MTTKKRWTKEEDRLLVQAITANPANIKEALMQLFLIGQKMHKQ